MDKKFWATVATGISCACVSLLSIAGITIAWFSVPSADADKERYLDGNIGLRNYFFSGDGTADSPYEIVSPIHFYNLTRLQNLGIFSNKTYFQIGHYFDDDDDPKTPSVLRCINSYKPNGDPNYSEYLEMGNTSPLYVSSTILPIGSESAPFYGVFDGKGMPIKNLTVTGYPEDIGVFGYVAHEGVVKGLVCEDLTINAVGVNATIQSKDNMLFSEDISNIFSSSSYLNSASLIFYKGNGGTYSNISGVGTLKHLNGNTGTRLTTANDDGINKTEHMLTDGSSYWYFDGYFEPIYPTYNKSGKDPFTYSWKSSSPLIKTSEVNVNGQKRIVIDLKPLRDSPSFNSKEKMQVDAKLSLIASVEVDGFVFSRVIQSYTIEFSSNGYKWEDSYDEESPGYPGYYTATIYCDYAESEDYSETDKNTNYHHGNNIGFLAGHVDGSMSNCYVYKGQFVFNAGGAGYTTIATETDSGLIGEIGTNVKNNIEADIGLVVKGDTGIMNFSKIYSNIRSDFFKSTYKGELENVNQLPGTLDGDYCLITNPSERTCFIWLVDEITGIGEWHMGIEVGSPEVHSGGNNFVNEDYIPHAGDNGNWKSSINYVSEIYGTHKITPNNTFHLLNIRIKKLPYLYMVYNALKNKWEPHFTLTWNGSTWIYESNAPTGENHRYVESKNKNDGWSNLNNVRPQYGLTIDTIPNGDVYKIGPNYYRGNGKNWDLYSFNPVDVLTYKGGKERDKGISYYCYNKLLNTNNIEIFGDYLRYYDIENGERQYIAKTGLDLDDESENRTWMNHTIVGDIRDDFNSVDFLWNRVIQDEIGVDRGLGVFKVITKNNSGAKTGSYSSYRLSDIGTSTINNKKGIDKVYFTTAEYDHKKGGPNWWNNNDGNQITPLRASTIPSYTDINSFGWPFSRDYNYVFELDLLEMESAGTNNYMWNTKSDFLINYLSSKLIDKYGTPMTPSEHQGRFGFMFRTSENEFFNSLSSYMPVGKPETKQEFTTYYKWDGENVKWISSATEPESGSNKTLTKPLNDVKELPDNPKDGDYYKVTAYYPPSSIVFRIENENGANVSVVGNNSDITIYSYDPKESANDLEALYTMRSIKQNSADDHRYFEYNVSEDVSRGLPEGYTGTETVQNGGNMTDGGSLYGHIFKLDPGDYVIGAHHDTANIYFLAVQGQTDGTIGSTDIATIGNGISNVDFLIKPPLLSDYNEETGIGGDKLASTSFKAQYNVNSGIFNVDIRDEIVDETTINYLRLAFNNSSLKFTTALMTYIKNPNREIYINEKRIKGQSYIVPIEND